MEMDIKVATWNVLAEAYAPQYKKRLLEYGENKDVLDDVFNWNERKERIRRVLTNMIMIDKINIICLQEVDFIHFDFIISIFAQAKTWNYKYMRRPNDKPDGLLIAWDGNIFESQALNVVEIDLNLLGSNDDLSSQKNNIAIGIVLKIKNHHALPLTVTVGNCHLHWFPRLEELRLMQASYFLKTLYELYIQSNSDLLIACGDFNSLLDSKVFELLKSGKIEIVTKGKGFICDASLGKVAKYLRALGIDALHAANVDTSRLRHSEFLEKLHSNEEYKDRILLTSSKSLFHRRNCPLQSILLPSQSSDDAVKEVIKRCHIDLNEHDSYSLCVKCNNLILPVKREAIPKERISVEGNFGVLQRDIELNTVPMKVFESNDELFMCSGEKCRQLFWWDENLDFTTNTSKLSSSARIKKLVMRLQQKCSLIEDSANHIVQMSIQERAVSFKPRIYRIPCLLVDACHSLGNERKTNFVESFQGCLDHIFYYYSSEFIGVESFPEINPVAKDGAKIILPNEYWPSDHCTVVTKLKISRLHPHDLRFN